MNKVARCLPSHPLTYPPSHLFTFSPTTQVTTFITPIPATNPLTAPITCATALPFPHIPPSTAPAVAQINGKINTPSDMHTIHWGEKSHVSCVGGFPRCGQFSVRHPSHGEA